MNSKYDILNWSKNTDRIPFVPNEYPGLCRTRRNFAGAARTAGLENVDPRIVLPLYFGTLAGFHATATAWSLASFCKPLEGIVASDFVLMRRTQLACAAAALRLQRYVWAPSTLPYDIIRKFLFAEIVPKVPASGEASLPKVDCAGITCT